MKKKKYLDTAYMDQDAEDIAKMEMPCQCDCGQWFDLNDGYSCDNCHKVFCGDCYDHDNYICKSCLSYRND